MRINHNISKTDFPDLFSIGYIGTFRLDNAQYRLRVLNTLKYWTGNHQEVGVYSKVNQLEFMNVTILLASYKHETAEKLLQKSKGYPMIYDVSTWHEYDKNNKVGGVCDAAYTVVTSNKENANKFEAINRPKNRRIFVIPDPYENEEKAPNMEGENIMWFGHPCHMSSLIPHYKNGMYVVSKNPTVSLLKAMGGTTVDNNMMMSDSEKTRFVMMSDTQKKHFVWWSLENEQKYFNKCAMVLLTIRKQTRKNECKVGSNRVIKSIMAGKFVITPEVENESWNEFKDYMWMGDVNEGIDWAINNKDTACQMIEKGQNYIRSRYHPKIIAQQWIDVIMWTWASWCRDMVEKRIVV
tara:strand:- start:5 stop:1060 length:1056 start_codon:yes stop_codon:yes gene_type:complete